MSEKLDAFKKAKDEIDEKYKKEAKQILETEKSLLIAIKKIEELIIEKQVEIFQEIPFPAINKMKLIAQFGINGKKEEIDFEIEKAPPNIEYSESDDFLFVIMYQGNYMLVSEILDILD